MQTQIHQADEGLILAIPPDIAAALGLFDSAYVELTLTPDGLTVRPIVAYDLDTLLAQITDDNRHEEISTGLPQGKEAW